MESKVKVGIIGGAGYTAGELTRLLIYHPSVKLVYSLSESSTGQLISSIHQDLVSETDLKFTSEMSEVDVIFLCKGHGQSKTYLDKNELPGNPKIIDLSQDFRMARGDHDFIYGLPELNSESIKSAKHLANPGCFATCIQLGLIPAFKSGSVQGDVQISGITGSTGAGQGFSRTSHFSWRNSNMSVYKALQHQHLHEIGQTVNSLAPGYSARLNFIPYRGNFTRGIIITSYFDVSISEVELFDAYNNFYQDAVFTHVVDSNPDIKLVVNTNKALVYPKVIDGQAVVISVIDNLLKGASGQAVQNMNLMLGLDERTGLNLKSIGY